MKKQSMFSKILSINIISMLVCIIVMGSTQMLMFTNYFSKQSEDYLRKNAETIVDMIKRNIAVDTLTNVINGFAGVTDSYIMVFDKDGRVISVSDDSSLLERPPLYLDSAHTKVVLSGKKNTTIGTMGNLFDETMFSLQLPITIDDETVLGAVSVSRPIPEHQSMKYDMFRILFVSMLVIAASSAMLSYFLAKAFSGPMKNIRATTKEFAKGNFSARVDKSAESSSITEISELAVGFNNMAFELERAEDIKNAFISDVSHELRTPMTTIGGFVAGMLDDTIPEEKQKEYLKIVHSEISRLSRLVNSFLDITRLQSDKNTLTMTDFDINELIRISIIGMESKIEEKRINVDLDLEFEKCFVRADRDSITRIITNLLDNAVKFTNDDGHIYICVKTLQKDIRISFKNSGKGIAPEQLPMIFNRFYKTDKSRSENREGTGIGLYLVKNILNAHGRNITVQSVEGEYAEFVFSLAKGKAPQGRDKKSDPTIIL